LSADSRHEISDVKFLARVTQEVSEILQAFGIAQTAAAGA
jgi:hypothetical protein